VSHIFISYARKDIDFAQKIVDALAANNLDTWIDWKSIPKGEDWEQEIYHGIQEADAFLFLISPDSVVSQMCNKEIAHAVKNGKRILPIVIRETDSKSIHPEISKRNWIFCRYKKAPPDIIIILDNFDDAIQQVQVVIHTDYEWLKYHTKLQIKALDWERIKDNSRLLRGKELREAEQRLAEINRQEDPQPTKIQREYLLASRRFEERRRQRVSIGLTTGILIMLAIAFVAVWQWQSAKEQTRVARARELAGFALTQRDERFDVSLLLSIEAFRKADIPQSRSVLLDNSRAKPQLLRYLQGHPNLRKIAYSQDGNTLISVSFDGTVQIWDVTTHKLVDQWPSKFYGYPALSPDGKILAVEDFGKDTISLWDISTHQRIGQPLDGHIGLSDLAELTFSPTGKMLASSYYKDSSIIIWDVNKSQPASILLTGGDFGVAAMAFSPDSGILAVAKYDNTIVLWNLTTQKQIGPPLRGHTDSIWCLVFSPDGKILASGGEDKSIILWDITSFQSLGQPLRGQSDWIRSVAFSPDGRTLATGTIDGSIFLWDVLARQPIGQPIIGIGSDVWNIVFDPDNKTMASNGLDGTIILWDLTVSEPIAQLFTLDSAGLWALSPDGKSIASVGVDGNITIWDLASRSTLAKILITKSDDIWSMAFSPDGKSLASIGCRGEFNRCEMTLWNLVSYQPVGHLFIGYASNLIGLAFSPDSRTLAISNAYTLNFWNVENHQPIGQTITGDGLIYSLAFSPDSKTLATGISQKVTLWNTNTRQSVGDLPNDDRSNITYLTFELDGKTLIGGTDPNGISGNSNIIMWNLANHQPIGQPLSAGVWISGLALSPDGRMIATGGQDSITLWGVGPLMPLGQSPIRDTSLTPSVDGVAFTTDGKLLITGNGDGTFILWEIDSQSWINKICQRAGRNFTRAEWLQYFPGEEYHLTCPQYPAGQ